MSQACHVFLQLTRRSVRRVPSARQLVDGTVILFQQAGDVHGSPPFSCSHELNKILSNQYAKLIIPSRMSPNSATRNRKVVPGA
jgi:hypothetical protein